ncbi:uncharacterized protein L3040_006008 [Drepanopeziza brunnea f. sp. 'multigermtubi']|uniref:RING finger domain protein n=1 Tax=Marssonina brunnea f. sp. multigermtubi (strain MB_m1) TaxID=1072389 RepID=K1XT58_MARBU|nr:RING finger domain protein [Drepanopeziza brunnea f. sp. 'multigermtubi' MB_m1]EKD15644.1 RING finger domain protein [Drepanopeziza brunnea f. sp. 'multigermtubi' MB_m1]KAJ5040352.1 hypothetical protein L3040_006008 [Drepanopeziza brunnea f. sp. 'multigermtubi']
MSSQPTPSALPDAGPQTPRFTTLAIVIFFSITGLLVLFFLVGLSIACTRARRHPERYGPRAAAPGRVRQTRNKGLAMAVLESIPIVRFGVKTETSEKDVQKDAELGEAGLGEDVSGTTRNNPHGKGDTIDDDDDDNHNSSNHNNKNNSSDRTEAEDIAADKIIPEIRHPVKEEPEQRQPGFECAICIADFVENEEVRLLPCSHTFHPACVDPWLLNVSGTCPICRYELEPGSSSNPPSDSTSPPDAAAAAATTTTTTTTTPTPAPPDRETNTSNSHDNPAAPPDATPAAATSLVPPPSDRRMSIRARLREIRGTSHSGPEYISALRRLYQEHEQRRHSASSSRRSSHSAPRRPSETVMGGALTVG